MIKDIVLYGSGGAAKGFMEIISDINAQRLEWNLLGYLDDDPSKVEMAIQSVPVLGNLLWLLSRPETYVAIAVGDPRARQDIFRRLEKAGHRNYAILVHPQAWMARGVKLGRGAVIYPLAAINAGAVIGEFVLANMNTTIGHDVKLGDFVTISPGSRVLGCAAIENGADLGANSVVLPGISIGSWSVLGAGAVATKSVPAHSTAVGVPAVVIRQRRESLED